MAQFEYKIKFEATDQAESVKKVSALVDIVKSLSTEDLIYIAEMSKKKPKWVEKAKPYAKFL